ncbi:MAG: hypothetical protein KUL79_16295, partial [Thauera sp.]|nr:hypothetical protein [Thauera sp.]
MSVLRIESPGEERARTGQGEVPASPPVSGALAEFAELQRTVERQAQMLSVLSTLQRGMLVGRSSAETFSAML